MMDIRDKSIIWTEKFEHFQSLSVEDLTLDELMYIHLLDTPGRVSLQGGFCASALHELTEMLSATFNNVRTQQYGPIFSAFSILDQIGTLYSSTVKATTYGAGIKRALDLFSPVATKGDIDALYCIRNGVFHDGSLANKSIHGNGAVLFRMIRDSGQLLTPSAKPWDGTTYHDQMTDYVTRLDLRELKTTVAESLEECRRQFFAGTLVSTVHDKREFFYKYLFFIRAQ